MYRTHNSTIGGRSLCRYYLCAEVHTVHGVNSHQPPYRQRETNMSLFSAVVKGDVLSPLGRTLALPCSAYSTHLLQINPKVSNFPVKRPDRVFQLVYLEVALQCRIRGNADEVGRLKCLVDCGQVKRRQNLHVCTWILPDYQNKLCPHRVYSHRLGCTTTSRLIHSCIVYITATRSPHHQTSGFKAPAAEEVRQDWECHTNTGQKAPAITDSYAGCSHRGLPCSVPQGTLDLWSPDEDPHMSTACCGSSECPQTRSRHTPRVVPRQSCAKSPSSSRCTASDGTAQTHSSRLAAIAIPAQQHVAALADM